MHHSRGGGFGKPLQFLIAITIIWGLVTTFYFLNRDRPPSIRPNKPSSASSQSMIGTLKADSLTAAEVTPEPLPSIKPKLLPAPPINGKITHDFKDVLDILPLITHRKQPPNLAIVITFVESQIDSMIASIRQWGERNFTACNRAAKPRYRDHLSLYFYFDQDLSARLDIVKKISDAIDQLKWIPSCLHLYGFLSAKLTTDETVYKYGNYIGPNKQWGRAFVMEEMKEADYMFFIEPDVMAIRDYWLDRVYEEVAFSIDDFWMKGSTSRIPAYPSFHMNGNAIYKLRDPKFHQVFIDTLTNDRSQPYDLNIWLIYNAMKTGGPEKMALFKEIQHMLTFSDFLQDWADTKAGFPMEDLLIRFPNTVLVHNKFTTDRQLYGAYK
eukprot:TRINITY_DN3182_c0_g1_i1.p1 TRINITY_DN3182_c0_g1~~TRINITY_DN3182_c0_g1_i1.p1  ORF type:complete len:382 (-),score=89.60 TRINITY_DN3182_c0_g1_i1:37-1182(-)